MTPRVVVFDLGKVLVDFDWSIAGRRIGARSGRPGKADTFVNDHAGLIMRYELGQLTTQQFFETIRQATEFLGTRAEFDEYFADIFTEITAMTGLQGALRKKGLPTWIFSNTNELAVEHIRRRYPFFGEFNGYVYSYQHGAMKPDARLYEVVERETGHRGEEILYVDDRPENVEAGARRGWQAVLHESPETTRSAFRKLDLA